MPPMTTLAVQAFDRPIFESVLKRRFTESFEIYWVARNWNGDNKGFFDYGPPECGLQANLVGAWRKHFVLEENMLEIDCSIITPEPVLRTSGHVDKFSDWMCKDSLKGEYLRADHLIENVLETPLASGVKVPDRDSQHLSAATVSEYNNVLANIDNYNGDELGELIERLDIRNPVGNGKVLPPVPFNLLIPNALGVQIYSWTELGSACIPTPRDSTGPISKLQEAPGLQPGLNTFRLRERRQSYWNEISPRSGLLRVREFLMAEIEHYTDPDNKDHERFSEVVDVELPLLDRDTQLSGGTAPKILTVRQAVEVKAIDNQTLGYFLARIWLFLLQVGVDRSKIRFRRYLANGTQILYLIPNATTWKEMAHYACGCWDAELLTSYGWMKCVGCADRSAYDLTVHSKFSGTELKVKEALHGNSTRKDIWEATLDKRLIGPRFKKDAKLVQEAIDTLDQSKLQALVKELDDQGVVTVETSTPLADGMSSVTHSRDLPTIKKETRVQTTWEYTPSVVEPSFGIGRILYCLLEHVYWNRPQDATRAVLSLPLAVAPTKVLIVPISAQPQFGPIVNKLSARLRRLGISNYVDSSGASIGKRYARNDELGTPLGITVDFDTVADGSLTLRDRDSTSQVRGSEEIVVTAIKDMVDGVQTWDDVAQRLPPFTTRGRED